MVPFAPGLPGFTLRLRDRRRRAMVPFSPPESSLTTARGRSFPRADPQTLPPLLMRALAAARLGPAAASAFTIDNGVGGGAVSVFAYAPPPPPAVAAAMAGARRRLAAQGQSGRVVVQWRAPALHPVLGAVYGFDGPHPLGTAQLRQAVAEAIASQSADNAATADGTTSHSRDSPYVLGYTAADADDDWAVNPSGAAWQQGQARALPQLPLGLGLSLAQAARALRLERQIALEAQVRIEIFVP